MKRLSPLIEKTEQFVRRGEVQRATSLLRQVDLAVVPHRFCVPLANVMRRCGMFPEAMRLTQRAIRGSKPGDKIHTTALAEYCTILIRLGSVEEAGRKLAPLESSDEPSVLIARFWYHFTRYEYRESVPLLEKWITTLHDPYMRLIAENNLAEALFATGKYSKSRVLLTRTIQTCESTNFLRLLANGLHIRSRCFAELGDLESSNADLDRALQVLKSTETGDASLIRRQFAINEAIATSSLAPINKLRASALRSGFWETLRELDFQSLRIQFRNDVLQKLYFGTPYPAYRERILTTFPKAQIDSEYIWGPRSVPRLDLATGEMSPPSGKWPPPTPLNLLTLRALLRDFYRPLGTREIYAVLFPSEEFEPVRSDDRVHQCIARLRRWLKDADLPLKVDLHGGGYTLEHESRPAIALRIPELLPFKLRSREVSGFVETLRERFSTSRDFTAREVREQLGLTSATTVRRLTEAVNRNELARSGSGKKTTYRLIN